MITKRKQEFDQMKTLVHGIPSREFHVHLQPLKAQRTEVSIAGNVDWDPCLVLVPLWNKQYPAHAQTLTQCISVGNVNKC